MAESSWPTVAGGRAITDVQWEQMVAGFAASGIIGSPTDTAVIYADATGMTVKVRSGKLGHVSGNGWYSGAADFTKTVTANSSGSTRYDLVVLRLTRSTRAVTVEVKAGTPGAGAPPAVTQDSISAGAGVWEIPLASVAVVNNASTIAATDVASLTRYIGAGNSASRPQIYSLVPPDTASGSWSNTGPPTSDALTATGMFQVAASRLTLNKQSADSALDVDLDLTGYPTGAGRIFCGVRVMAAGYTSSNHVVGAQWANLPLFMYTDAGWLGTALVSMSGHADHAHSVTPNPHNHGITLPHIHYRVSGRIHIPGLAVRTYTLQPWIYVSAGTFTMDGNDMLTFRVAEV